MLLLVLCLLTCLAFSCPKGHQKRYMNTTKTPKGEIVTITRKAIAACMRHWVSMKIPYCQCNGPAECCGNCPFCSTTRCDCSGYVSACWGIKGYTTHNLPDVSHRISKGDLLIGDIMLYQAEHVVFFGGWANSGHTKYHAYQEAGCHVSSPHHAFASEVEYPMSWDPSKFLPYRFNHVS